ncbi:MAG: PEP-CTERM sorting domain-containing protein [Planctomycetota bacterium]|nr:MAG: PEP-CTERM sorting domain-containing protein [Planctomycetota bacterium]
MVTLAISCLFVPSALAATYQVTQITDNEIDDFSPQVSGDNIAWYAKTGIATSGFPTTAVFFFDGTTITQISNESTGSKFPKISGNNVVWAGNTEGRNEIFLYDGATTTQLTSTVDTSESNPQVSGDNVVWQGDGLFLYDGVTTTMLADPTFPSDHRVSGNNVVWRDDGDIFSYDGVTTTQLTSGSGDNVSPRISGDNVIWRNNGEIYQYDGVSTSQLTNDGIGKIRIETSGDNVVWEGNFHPDDNEIYLYDGVTTIRLTDNSFDDTVPQMSGDNIVWQGGSKIFVFDGVATTRISDLIDCFCANMSPHVSGANIVWTGHDGNDWEIFMAMPIDSPSNASFVTGSDLNTLDVDFGSVAPYELVAPIGFDIANLLSAGVTARLDLDSISGTGDTTTLTTDLAPFTELDAGSFLSFEAQIDTNVPGLYNATYQLDFTDALGTDQTLTLNVSGEVLAPDFPSNASFSTVSDQNVLSIDFGTVSLDAAAAVVGFDLANLLGAGTTAHLDLVSITGTGKTGTLTTDLAPFADLVAGDSSSFEAALDTSVPGLFGASYALSFTDILGTSQTLTLSLSGEVALPANDPNIPDLIYDAVTGEVILDPDGSSIIGYSLRNESGAFLPGNFNPVLGGVATATSIILEEAAFGSLASPASIGNVFPAGMDITELFQFLSNNQVSRSLGTPLVPFDLIVVVPEPSTYAMAALGLMAVGALGWRRRCSRLMPG